MRFTILIAGAVFCASLAAPYHVRADVPEYTVMRTDGGIVIDGVLDEADWAKAESAGEFAFPWWTSGEKEQTEAKILWDDEYVYFAFRCDDKHIWADHYSTNDWTYNDDCAEIFWNPGDEESGMYYTFEINCLGNLLSVYKNPYHAITERESRVMVPRIGQTIQGTVNKDSDTDTGWVLEVAVRFADYPELSVRERPLPGDTWRVGLNRCGGKTNAQFSQWSPSATDRPNFHRPTEFGRIMFSELAVGSTVNVEDDKADVMPAPVKLLGNRPNPFNAATTLSFSLAEEGHTALVVYDVGGRKVRTLLSERLLAGVHTVVWDSLDDAGAQVSSGVYIVRLVMGDHMATGRVAFVK